TADVAADAEPLALNEARLHLRIIAAADDATAHPDDALVTALIKAARQAAELETGRKLGEQTFDVLLDAFPLGQSLPLP
ncbi:hypothetical protein, partial [Escherichia coli]|uniref:hypothetical protein n=1 Tax=Escherichia coli TaxID=562 RepID=UPI003862B76B